MLGAKDKTPTGTDCSVHLSQSEKEIFVGRFYHGESSKAFVAEYGICMRTFRNIPQNIRQGASCGRNFDGHCRRAFCPTVLQCTGTGCAG